MGYAIMEKNIAGSVGSKACGVRGENEHGSEIFRILYTSALPIDRPSTAMAIEMLQDANA